MRLVIATRNRHKLEEIKAIFRMEGLDIRSAFDYPELPDVVEDAETFEGNAAKKARELAVATGCWSLADDSGLEVTVLGNAPGVYSARYAGEPSNDDRNNAKLLRELTGVEDRSARFRCCMALADPEGTVRVVNGVCPGTILEAPRGEKGFGYDPLFVPDGYDQSFAELPAAIKNGISHRARALQVAELEWGGMLRGLPA
jgi:XTP/dITP diphosphohydrolase